MVHPKKVYVVQSPPKKTPKDKPRRLQDALPAAGLRIVSTSKALEWQLMGSRDTSRMSGGVGHLKINWGRHWLGIIWRDTAEWAANGSKASP